MATTRPIGGKPFADDSVDIPAWPSLEHILIDADGRQHLVLRTHGVVLQLEIEGADVTNGPVSITFLARGLEAARRTGLQLISLNRILKERATVPSVDSKWTRKALRYRDAIIALDGHAAGASYREIAIVIHGQAKVDREWASSALKDQMRRNLQRGLTLSRGGYRALLRQGW